MITGPYARRAGLSSTDGVLVTGVSAGGPAASGDGRQGDIILSIDRKAGKDLAAFEKLYDELVKTKREKVLVSVKRGTQVILRVLSPATRDPEEDE